MIKEGQVYESEQYGGLYVVTRVWNKIVHCLFNDGFVTKGYDSFIPYNRDKLLAEYPTWQDAINGKEFKNE